MSPSGRQWLLAALVSGCVHCTILVAATVPRDSETLARAAGRQTTVGIVSAASHFQDGEVEVEAIETEDTLESTPTERGLPPVVEAVEAARAAQAVATAEAPRALPQVTAARMLSPARAVDPSRVVASEASPIVASEASPVVVSEASPVVAAAPVAPAVVPAEAAPRSARTIEATDAARLARSAASEVAPVEGRAEPATRVAPGEIAEPGDRAMKAAEPVQTAARVLEDASTPRLSRAVRPRPRPSRKDVKRAPRRSVAARASHGGGGTGGKSRSVAGREALTNYLGKVSARLHRQKRYPRSARNRRLEGTAVISFTIDAAGRVVRSRLTRGSGHALLDREVRAMLARAAPFPPIPKSLGRRTVSLTVPVRFAVR